MKRCFGHLLLAVVLAVWPLAALAQESAAPHGPSDPAELEAFLDGIMAVHLRTNHVAGATISVVKDGRLFFAKGYGFADLEKREPVAADRTLFRPGSVSKLFTWTAVMQLSEQGRIDLDADVNTYLKDLKIPATFPQPITMNHLLSHTPGFEEKATGMGVLTAKDLMPLGKFLATYMPARVRPPGVVTSYSNYGTALAGYIVQVVSGMPFEDYVERNIFEPLDMKHSTFREPLPPALAPDMSVGYTFENGVFKPQEFELINGMLPAGSLSTCATDMARFMIAHLQNGRYGEHRILKEETAEFMHNRLFGHDPRVAGNAHGFWESNFNGLHLIGHGGDTIYFHSELALIPGKDLGWFVSYNSPNGPSREELFEAFLDRYYPAPESSAPSAEVQASPESRAASKARLRRVSGTYGVTRVNETSYEKLMGLFMTANVRPTGEGNLLVTIGVLGIARQYAEVEPWVFRQIEGHDTLVFKPEAGEGRVLYAFSDGMPHAALVKLAWYQTPTFHYFLLGFCVLFFLSAVLGWPLAALSRVICRRKREGRPAPKAARWLAGTMSGLFVVFLFLLLVTANDEMELIVGVPALLKFSLVLPLIGALIGLAVLYFVVKAWLKGYWTRCQRVHYTVVALAALAFVWFLNYWNLLGWRF
jgi:CubicO group peptidase (beta-lactamase class C family)